MPDARNYDPQLGTWFNVDPLAEKTMSHTPYHYVYNNPVNYVDPDGMSPWSWSGSRGLNSWWSDKSGNSGGRPPWTGYDPPEGRSTASIINEAWNSSTGTGSYLYTVSGGDLLFRSHTSDNVVLDVVNDNFEAIVYGLRKAGLNPFIETTYNRTYIKLFRLDESGEVSFSLYGPSPIITDYNMVAQASGLEVPNPNQWIQTAMGPGEGALRIENGQMVVDYGIRTLTHEEKMQYYKQHNAELDKQIAKLKKEIGNPYYSGYMNSGMKYYYWNYGATNSREFIQSGQAGAMFGFLLGYYLHGDPDSSFYYHAEELDSIHLNDW